ncbi:MAG: cytochrome C biogenesis protein [Thaumarchaeota archaeon]|nr:cytochrome C biogenesis protein [Nitrososphaerota archaeon]
MAQEIAFSVAFAGGILSFFSPCVLPVIPGYLASISGTSIRELSSNHRNSLRRRVFLNSVSFTLAFSMIFIILGFVIAGVFGFIEPGFQIWFNRIGGSLIILFGIHTTGLYEIPLFARSLKLNTPSPKGRSGTGIANSAIVGAAFGVGWTPCFGPILASILVLAGTSGSAVTGGLLLAIYSMGLGVPFLLTGFFTQQVSGFISKNKTRFIIVTQVSGMILIGLGVLIFTNSFVRLLAFLPSGLAVLIPR